MKWFRMAGSLVAGIFVVANALNVRGGDLDPIPLQQVKTETTVTLEGRWIVVSHTLDGDEQDSKGDKVYIAKGRFRFAPSPAPSPRSSAKPRKCGNAKLGSPWIEQKNTSPRP